MNLPVENYDLNPGASVHSPDLIADRQSTGRLIMEKSLQKSMRSKLQTPKVSIPMSERKSVEGSNYQD
jgi:hypothetical protein